MPSNYAQREITRKGKIRDVGLAASFSRAQPAAMREPAPGLHYFLRAWRKSRKLTLEQLANMIGSKVSTIQGWEVGARAMDLKDLEKLAAYYGVPAAALLEAPPGSADMERLRRAARIVRDAPADVAEDWLRMGERLAPSEDNSA
jgi:transcriptional regulator with XRE-family HTH domain